MFSARIRHQKEVRVTGLGWAGALVGTRYFLSANDNILTELLIGRGQLGSGYNRKHDNHDINQTSFMTLHQTEIRVNESLCRTQ